MKTSKPFVFHLAVGSLALIGCATVNSVKNAQKGGQRNMVTGPPMQMYKSQIY
jgi:hypothetical protein